MVASFTVNIVIGLCIISMLQCMRACLHAYMHVRTSACLLVYD